jgi:hypothetical protein
VGVGKKNGYSFPHGVGGQAGGSRGGEGDDAAVSFLRGEQRRPPGSEASEKKRGENDG